MIMRLPFVSLLGFALVMPVAAQAHDLKESIDVTLRDIQKEVQDLRKAEAVLREDKKDGAGSAEIDTERKQIQQDRADLRRDLNDLRREIGKVK